MNSKPLLHVSHLTLVREMPVLQDISFALQRGQITTLLGPSGSGKTSLLRCLNRLETPGSGDILLDGKNTRDMEITELRRRIGLVFQGSALLPMTVGENICLGPLLRQRSLSEEECLSLLGQVGLARDFLGRRADVLSVGEQQRVALAQVLANRPEVLLLDEPTSALDPTAVLTVENLIRSLHRELQTAMLVVTHNVAQALRFDAETLVLVGGEVIARGNIRDLMESTDNEILKKFFEGKLDTASLNNQKRDNDE